MFKHVSITHVSTHVYTGKLQFKGMLNQGMLNRGMPIRGCQSNIKHQKHQ